MLLAMETPLVSGPDCGRFWPAAPWFSCRESTLSSREQNVLIVTLILISKTADVEGEIRAEREAIPRPV